MSSLWRMSHIFPFQVAAKPKTNKLQTKKNMMFENHKVHINYSMTF